MKSRYKIMLGTFVLGVAAFEHHSLLSKKPEIPADTLTIAQYILENHNKKDESEDKIIYTQFNMNMAFPQQEGEPVPEYSARVELADKIPFAKDHADFGGEDTLTFEVFKLIREKDEKCRPTSYSKLAAEIIDDGVNGFGNLGDGVSLKIDDQMGNIAFFGKNNVLYYGENKKGKEVYNKAAHAIAQGIEVRQ